MNTEEEKGKMRIRLAAILAMPISFVLGSGAAWPQTAPTNRPKNAPPTLRYLKNAPIPKPEELKDSCVWYTNYYLTNHTGVPLRLTNQWILKNQLV